MMQTSVFVVLLVAISVASAQSENSNSSWIGQWRSTGSVDNFGGDLYTCVSGNKIQGTFSQIGYIEGSLVGRNVTGTWYVGGFTDQVIGGFNWLLNADDESFTGYWWYVNAPCVTFPWNGTRRFSQFDQSLCYPVTTDTSLSVDGHWQYGDANFGLNDLYICASSSNDVNYFYASATFLPLNVKAYYTGRLFDNGVSGQGSYYDDNPGEQGISIFKMLDQNTLVTFLYNVPTFADAALKFNDPSVAKSILTWTRVGKSGQQICRSNNGLADIGFAGTWTDSESGPASRFYLCTSGSQAWGVYGEFGYVDGTISSNGKTISGNYYDSGNCETCFGTYVINLGADGASFSGYYIINGTNVRLPWIESRVDVTDLGDRSCATLAGGSIDMSGNWQYSKNSSIDICLTYGNATADGSKAPNGTFQASYSILTENGYCTGNFNENGQAAQVNCITSAGRGEATFRMTSVTDLVAYAWKLPNGPDTPTTITPCDLTGDINTAFFAQHNVRAFTYHGAVKNNSCARYSNFTIIPPNAAGSLSPSFGIFVLFAVLFVGSLAL